MSNKLLKTIDTLNSQLTILNIEGYQSECCIYHWEEEQVNEEECAFCNGDGELETYWEDCSSAGYENCPECGGGGIIEEYKIVPFREVEISSNIFIN